MSNLFGGGKTSTTVVQSIDPEFKERALEVYDMAKAVAGREYQPIIGDLTPTQMATAANIYSTAGELPTYLSEARRVTRLSGPQFDEASGYIRSAEPNFAGALNAIYRPDFNEARGLVRAASAMPDVREAQATQREAQGITKRFISPAEYAEAQQFARQGAGYQPGTIAAGMGAYTNPYETDVVQTALGDIERSRQLATQQGAAQAARARAFGGSRQGVAEAETNRAALEQAARTAAQLRQQGFVTAGEFAGRDIGFDVQGALARNQAANILGNITQAAQMGGLAGAGQIGALGAQVGQLGLAGSASEVNRANALAEYEKAQAELALKEASLRSGMAQATSGARLAQGQQLGAFQQAQSQAALSRGSQLGNLALAGTQGQIGAQQAAFNAQEAIRANEEAQRAEAFGYPERQLQILQQALGFFPNPMTQSQTQRQTLGPMDVISRLGGTAASGLGAYALLCWVAREVYGAENPRWLMFRHWVITDAPKWFLRLYIKHGEKFAAWISDKPTLKNAIRAFMDRKIQKKFGGH